MIRRDDIVALARSWVGTPYHHQASVRGAGCDCLGVVRGVYCELLGVELSQVPPYSRDWAEARREETLLVGAATYLEPVTPAKAADAGDVVVFRLTRHAMAKHAAILTTPDTMVHAQEKVGCVEVHLGSWWRRHIVGAFRFPEVA